MLYVSFMCVVLYVWLMCECFDEVMKMFVEGFMSCCGVCGVYLYCDVVGGMVCGCCNVMMIVIMFGGMIFDMVDYVVLFEL